MATNRKRLIGSLTALTTAAALSGAYVVPAMAEAAPQPNPSAVQLAACNPCNPCAASACNPCNPCAAGACNPCNPCAASPCNPCNPCAANPCNPCNPCAAN
ncbi:MAG: hypothetical protein R3316_11035 [Rhodovibrionaceae bacterium]|nr:hypothetical protein [Rhodovibrionaceae bacterium]